MTPARASSSFVLLLTLAALASAQESTTGSISGGSDANTRARFQIPALAAPAWRAPEDEPDIDEPAVRITPSLLLEAQDVMAHVTVPRQAVNRRLVVTVEGPAYYASTERQLDGDAAARTHEFAFRQLPEGEYSVRVIVERSRGTDRDAETKFSVRGALSPMDVDSTGQRPGGP